MEQTQHGNGTGSGDHPGHRRGPEGRRGRRPFDYGALRLLALGMIAERPQHGYEIMQAIEERTGGGYRPSPGVIYPTLSWLEDMGFARSDTEGGRRRYTILPPGAAFLEANRPALSELQAQAGSRPGAGDPGHGRRPRAAPAAVLSAMDELKQALRMRFAGGPVDAETAETIAAAIRVAAGHVHRTRPTMTSTDATLTSTAVVETPKAAGYAAQLCKHFSHRVPARFENADGEITFGVGICRLHAEGDRLTLTVEGADADAIARLQDVVGQHLLRFAFREELRIDWQPA